MKRELNKRLGILNPPDGYTNEETAIVGLINNCVLHEIYGKLPTPRMKAIVAMHFELGYDQETLGNIFGVRQEQIALDIKNIKKVLTGQPYKPHNRHPKIKISDLLSMCMTISQS